MKDSFAEKKKGLKCTFDKINDFSIKRNLEERL